MKPLPQINSWADVQAQTLTKAEQKLIAAVKAGNLVRFGKTVPTKPTAAVLIRAPLLRYLILGGCAECRTPTKGVTVFGAWIAQELDLRYEAAAGRIMLASCHIAEQPYLRQLQTAGLILNGSKLPKGLTAQGAIMTGDLFLRSIHAQGEVNIAGAQITGQLSCTGAKLENAGGDALNAQAVKVDEGVFLGNVTTKGRVTLSGAQITGQLGFVGAKLENADGDALNAQGVKVGEDVFLRNVTTKGRITLCGAQITGQLSCTGATLENAKGAALLLQGASVQGGFFWRGIKKVEGRVDLNSAHFKDITDDAASWEKCENITLVGLTYDQLHGTPDLPARLAWLKKGAVWNDEFHPQPYEQLAKVWRANGYRADAREIAVQKEVQQRKAQRRRWRDEWRWRRRLLERSQDKQLVRDQFIAKLTEDNRVPPAPFARFAALHPTAGQDGFIDPLTLSYAQLDFRNQQRWQITQLRLKNLGQIVVDATFKSSVGYGYRPERSIYIVAGLILCLWLAAAQGWRNGDFAPNSDVILASADWQILAEDRENTPNPAATWSAAFAKGQDYQTFQPLIYAADVVIPIIDLGQERAWAPSTNRGSWGRWLFRFNPVFVALGWIVTAIGAAAVTGIIRRD